MQHRHWGWGWEEPLEETRSPSPAPLELKGHISAWKGPWHHPQTGFRPLLEEACGDNGSLWERGARWGKSYKSADSGASVQKRPQHPQGAPMPPTPRGTGALEAPGEQEPLSEGVARTRVQSPGSDSGAWPRRHWPSGCLIRCARGSCLVPALHPLPAGRTDPTLKAPLPVFGKGVSHLLPARTLPVPRGSLEAHAWP